MRKLTPEEWEEKYIRGDIEQFDQKNHMFIRPIWDPSIYDKLDDWSFIGPFKDKKGYALEDQALRWASSRGTMMALFNTFKPNPVPASKAVQELLEGGKSAMAFSGYRPPEGIKTDTSNPAKVTRTVKKAAIWFDADIWARYGKPKEADCFWDEWEPEKGKRM